MKQERAGGRRIPEIHAHFHAMKWSFAFPERNFDRIAHVLVVHRLSIYFQHLKVNLVHVKGMGFKGAVFNRPIFNGSHFSYDDGFLVGLEDFLLLSLDRD